MSPRFPDANYRQVVKVAKSLGFSLFRAGKGSHEIWKRASDGRFTTIPKKAILEDLQISPEEFLKTR